jgi:hypothetical protein
MNPTTIEGAEWEFGRARNPTTIEYMQQTVFLRVQ